MELVILRSWEDTTQLEAIWDFLFILICQSEMAQRNTSNYAHACVILRYYFVPFVFGLLILFFIRQAASYI